MDILRIIAMFMVVIIHVSASNFKTVDVSSFEWKTFNFTDSLARSAVPIFVMISGMFFLRPDKQLSYKKLYQKSIVRLLIAYVFWSIAYAVYMMYYKGKSFTAENTDWFVNHILDGHYILWYIPMLIGIYILVPVLRPITEKKDRRLLEYILIIFFVFGILLRTMNKVGMNDNLSIILNQISLDGFVGYVGYFLLGYYLATYDLKKPLRIVIYTLGILSVFVTAYMSYSEAMELNKPSTILYGYHMMTTFFEGFAIILFVKNSKLIQHLSEKPQINKRIVEFSGLTFGMYLIHDMILKQFTMFGITTVSSNPVIMTIFIVVSVFVLSLIATYFLRKIPFVKKYLM
ncbi:acyltransferase [Kurthia zopfii]|uniref:acyltransferase n=1 Tax=Kurthia zopfii TaxID=1650 RepID=UPI000F81A8C8|nr:acyltransferase family protein [Kurthia zopfii]